MPRSLPNPTLVKIHRSYTVEELAELFGRHEQTIRRWITVEGLQTVDDARPALINGMELREFLAANRKRRRKPCGPGRFYCFGCQTPRVPAGAMVDFVPSPDTAHAGQLQALCPECGRLMQRRATRHKAAAAMPGIAIDYRALESTSRTGEGQERLGRRRDTE
jgi:hypothetical protein